MWAELGCFPHKRLLSAGKEGSLYPKKPMKLAKVAMLLASGDADMYDGAMFSYRGDFLDYLGLEDMGVITAQAYAPDIPAEKNEEIRRFGASL